MPNQCSLQDRRSIWEFTTYHQWLCFGPHIRCDIRNRRTKVQTVASCMLPTQERAQLTQGLQQFSENFAYCLQRKKDRTTMWCPRLNVSYLLSIQLHCNLIQGCGFRPFNSRSDSCRFAISCGWLQVINHSMDCADATPKLCPSGFCCFFISSILSEEILNRSAIVAHLFFRAVQGVDRSLCLLSTPIPECHRRGGHADKGTCAALEEATTRLLIEGNILQ
jgi:hypothetical protein